MTNLSELSQLARQPHKNGNSTVISTYEKRI
jgi:hypothetical protein